jgi:RecA-family ATPase
MSDYRPGFVGVDHYLRLERERETWLLKPLIPAGGAALLYGDPKVGKSYMGIQLALALSGQAPDWLGFPVHQSGKVLYLQLDTPRSVWAVRFEDMLQKGNLRYNSESLLLADRDSIKMYPFDILQPSHTQYLQELISVHDPVAVIIDTLRESHSGDEDSSTVSRNVIGNLVSACGAAAVIIISHGRKPNPDMDKDLLADHRGSSYITGRMDAIMRLTKSRLYYTGRSIEAGDIKIQRMDNGLWEPVADEIGPEIAKVMADVSLKSMRAKARSLATKIGKTEEAAMSLLRRLDAAKVILTDGDKVDVTTGEVIEEELNVSA